MNRRSKILRALDMATRPVLVPCYLLAARLSVPVVHWRRSRVSFGVVGPGADPFPAEVPRAPIENGDCPEVSVVIPVRNGEAVLGRCLDSIRALDYPSDRLEIVVADNDSSDGTVAVARRYEVAVVPATRRGAAAARNAGIAAARGTWIAMTDADCVVHSLWLKHLVAVSANERSSAVGGRILSVCGDPIVREFCAREGVLDQKAAVEGRLLPRPFVITANGLFRRDLIRSIGGFDEDFPAAAAEDVDLGWRLGDAGHRLEYAPHALVGHRQRERGVEIHAQFYRYGRSEVWLYLKHRRHFDRSDLSRHLWIRPLLYRHFWEAVWRCATARDRHQRRLWRLVILKELGHMAGKLEANRRWRTWSHFGLWTHE